MTVEEIDAFLSIHQSRNISEAARRLFISQPTLSRRIKTLEEELGYSLLIRSKGKTTVYLTPRGEQFIQLAIEWRNIWDSMKGLNSSGGAPTYRLSFSGVNSLVTHIIYPAVYSFIQKNPNIQITLESQHSYNAFPRVREGILNGAFVANTFYDKNIRAFPLWNEPMVLIYGSALDISTIERPSDLDVSSEIRIQWNQEFRDWHNYWFSDNKNYRLDVDQLPAVEHFFKDNPTMWMVAPISSASIMARTLNCNYHFMDNLPSRPVYFITKERPSSTMKQFMFHLIEELKAIPFIQISDVSDWLENG